MVRRITGLALVALANLVFAAGLEAGLPPVAPGDLLGSTGAVGGSLISIDPATGAGTERFTLGSLGPVTEIRFRQDGVLFGSTGSGSSNIITIDPDTGAESLVGTHPVGAVNGLEFVGSTLYGAFFDVGGPEGGASTSLVEVDQTDGALTPVGPITGYSPVRGLAYDPDTATMYAVGTPLAGGQPGDELLTIDLATGTPTSIGPTGFAIIGGITFGPDGTLYGGIALADDGGEGGDGALVTLDPSTGAATVIGDTGFGAISGLAFVPGLQGGGDVIVAIPTASELGLVALAALLAVAALALLRRA